MFFVLLQSLNKTPGCVVIYKLFSLLIHTKLLVFSNLKVSPSIPRLKFSIYLVILVQTVIMFRLKTFFLL